MIQTAGESNSESGVAGSGTKPVVGGRAPASGQDPVDGSQDITNKNLNIQQEQAKTAPAAERAQETAESKDAQDDDTFECDMIKLHLIGAIQGKTGHVIHVSYPLGHVVAVDENILDLTCITPPAWTATSSGANSTTTTTPTPIASAMLGTSLRSWMPEDLFDTVFLAMHSLQRDRVNRTFQFSQGYAFTISIATTTSQSHPRHQGGTIMAIEIEPEDPQNASKNYQDSLTYLSRLMELFANDKIVKLACDSLFEIFPEYDRGMVYKFNDDLSGEIIHEVRRGQACVDGTTYLGHRFPKYDIPQSARDLYKKNILRYIRDANEPDIPVLSKNDTPVDLTQLRCRACAKPHLVYMKNMGVKSSMSIAILVEDELWGLFAFHGYRKAFHPSLHQRIACETVASMVSARVESLVRKSGNARIIGMAETLQRWTPSQTLEYNLSYLGEGLIEIVQADVLVAKIETISATTAGAVMGAAGNATAHHSRLVIVGDKSLIPNDKVWQTLLCQPNQEISSASSRKDIEQLELTEEDCPASGFVHFREGATQVFLGRRSSSKDVKWAGNPDQPKIRGADGRLNPRNSFAMYMETARKESRPWSDADLNVIQVLKDRICSGHAHEWVTALLRNDIEEANMRYFSAIDRAKDNSDFFAHMVRTTFEILLVCYWRQAVMVPTDPLNRLFFCLYSATNCVRPSTE